MLTGIIIFITGAALGVAIYVLKAGQDAEKQKYYDAAYKIIKENCLKQSIQNQGLQVRCEQKIMVYLKWKDSQKQGFVFDPESPIRIGRSPEMNDVSIRDHTVSEQHCVLYLYQGELFVQDLNSGNGTWLKQGFRKRLVHGIEQIVSGDCIMVGDLRIKVIIFAFDMTYM